MTRFAGVLLAAAMTVSPLAAQAGGAGTGSFTGASNHVTKGEVEVVKADGGWEVHLKESFWFDGAPDPRIAFGKDGTFADGTDFEPLRQDTGAQVYKVPASIDPEDFDTVVLWCRQFSVPLGQALLK
ncbi:MAG: DM13 domain-containing protein [Pseudomonadota bacterium]